GLRLVVVKHSLLGTHAWYQQTLDGRPVLGGYLVRHVTTRTGAVRVDDGREAIRGRVATKATVARAAATQAALLAVARAAHAPARAEGPAALAIRPGARARLVYDVFAMAEGQDWESLVDATSGRVLSARSLVEFGAAPVGQVFSPNPVVQQQD